MLPCPLLLECPDYLLTSNSIVCGRMESTAADQDISGEALTIADGFLNLQHEHPLDDLVSECGEYSCSSPITLEESESGEDSCASPTTLKESESGMRKQLGRGQHVRDRPELSENARNGQKFWAERWKSLKAEWDQENFGDSLTAFAHQLEMKKATNTKSKSAALLLMLQMCAKCNIINPHPFEDNTKTSFLGWTGFQVVYGCGAEFRRRIESLFPDPHKPCIKRLNTILRSVNLVPKAPLSWVHAWNGQSPFVFQPAGENTNGRRFRQ